MDHTWTRVAQTELAKMFGEGFVQSHLGELSDHHQTVQKQLILYGGYSGQNKPQNQWRNCHAQTSKEDK